MREEFGGHSSSRGANQEEIDRIQRKRSTQTMEFFYFSHSLFVMFENMYEIMCVKAMSG